MVQKQSGLIFTERLERDKRVSHHTKNNDWSESYERVTKKVVYPCKTNHTLRPAFQPLQTIASHNTRATGRVYGGGAEYPFLRSSGVSAARIIVNQEAYLREKRVVKCPLL